MPTPAVSAPSDRQQTPLHASSCRQGTASPKSSPTGPLRALGNLLCPLANAVRGQVSTAIFVWLVFSPHRKLRTKQALFGGLPEDLVAVTSLRRDEAPPPGSGQAARLAVRSGAHRGPTAGLAPGYVQGNLAILPQALAADFMQFCRLNPKPCPLIGT